MVASDLAGLLGLEPSGVIRWGTGRTRAMLHRLGCPHMAYRSVHIGGTNGKGSVAAMVDSILRLSGKRVGLYTSPHLIDFNERIRMAGQPADPELLETGARALWPLAAEFGATFFETSTVLAFWAFAEVGVDFVVAEVGLGGRLDSTNVLLPEVTAITQVGWDHADYLGDTLTAIAGEKAGICKPGVPLVLGRLEPEPRSVIREQANRAGAPVLELGAQAQIGDIEVGSFGTSFLYRGLSRESEARDLSCPLIGAHQAQNAALAAMVCESLGDPDRPSFETIRVGMGQTRWPGRVQIERSGGRTWVLDVAHNPLGMEALAQTMEALAIEPPIVALVAILGDKPWREMLSPLMRVCGRAIFTIAPSSPESRRWDPNRVAEILDGDRVEVIPDFGIALARAQELAETVLVTGSSYTVGDAMRGLGIEIALHGSKTPG